jgi:sugar/nucleoside kinase (ribokinase family)
MDLVMRVPALPERGGDVLAETAEFTPGGGFNVLTAARRFGLPAVYAGAHGTGPFGDRVRAGLAAEDIELLLPARTDQDTGFTVALVDTGERTFVTSTGAEGHLTAPDTAALAARVRPGDLVQLSGYGLLRPDTAQALTRLTDALPDGVVLSLDPGPLVADIPGPVLERVLRRCDWLSCNRREGGALTGRRDEAGAAAELRDRLGPRTGVVVRGDAAGCWIAAPGADPVHLPGRPVAAVDANGAGDAHVGAFLAELAAGAPPLAAAETANSAAAYAVTRRGPATGPTRRELALFLAGA